MDDLIKITPTPDDGLTRQGAESYILVDPNTELELRHLKGMFTLGSLQNMDLENPQNARAGAEAFDKAVDLLSLAVRKWHWLDRRGEVLEVEPGDNAEAFETLSMDEINWMLENVSKALKEEAAPEGS